MKNLKEKLAKKAAILTEIEASVIKGKDIITGPTTRYYGPPNPSVIYTYYRGVLIGRDPLSGSMFGDWWKYIPTKAHNTSELANAAVTDEGKMEID
jgi:hypothetical protein